MHRETRGRALKTTTTAGILLLAASSGCGRGASDGTATADGGSLAEAGAEAAEVPLPDGPIGAGLAPPSPYAGLWAGKTNQDLPLSLVVAEDGTLTDIVLRGQLEYPDGVWCATNFSTLTFPRLIDGRAKSQLRSPVDSFRIPFEVHFTSPTTATGMQGGYSGPYDIRCGTSHQRMGTGPLLSAGPVQLERVRGVLTPAPEDRPLAGGRGSPVPVGNLDTSCSHGAGTKHRFCAFAGFGTTGERDLWVVDLARSGEGRCDEPSASAPRSGCLLLTRNLWMQAPSSGQGFPRTHRFHGDTLMFRTEATSEGQSMFAWRPGWRTARRLVDKVFGCTATLSGDAVACLTNYSAVPMGPGHADLWAGKLGDGTVPLKKIGRLLLVTTADRTLPQPPSMYRYGLSPTGEEVLWSARVEDVSGAAETLFAARLSDPQPTPQLLAADVSQWQFSRDGLRLHWLRGQGMGGPGEVGRGILERSPYPLLAGTTVALGPARAYYDLSTAAGRPPGLLALTPDGQLRFHANPDLAPQAFRVVDSGVAALRTLSPDLTRVTYSKLLAGGAPELGDLYVADLDGTHPPCPVGTETEWASPVFSSSSSFLTAWRTDDVASDEYSLVAVDSRTCQHTRTVPRVFRWTRLPNDRFLIASASLPLRGFDLVSLGVLDVRALGPLTPLVETASGSWGVRVEPESSPPLIDLVYGVNAGWRSDGVYHRSVTY